MIEYDLPFEYYDSCKACDGYGNVQLMITDEVELGKWAKRLGQEECFYGYNFCNKCNGTGLVVAKRLPDLELE